jgi:hypothetical protein
MALRLHSRTAGGGAPHQVRLYVGLMGLGCVIALQLAVSLPRLL